MSELQACAGTTFLDEYAGKYWPQEVIEKCKLLPDDALEEDNVGSLPGLLRKYAPQAASSFACEKNWWEKHWGTPEAHVSLIDGWHIIAAFTTPTIADVQAPSSRGE